MKRDSKFLLVVFISFCLKFNAFGQKDEIVKLVKGKDHSVDIFFGDNLFTTFLYPDSLAKPFLFPVRAANGTIVTRSFPLVAKTTDPTDHPHQIGIWFNYENLNGIDFWNNSYAIPAEKKNLYGWIKTDSIYKVVNGKIGLLSYHANWCTQQNMVLAEEMTRLEFSGDANTRIIDRTTTLKARTDLLFKDAKDGLIGFRLAHELEIPIDKDQEFKDDKGNVTIVKAGTDKLPNGTYLTSEGKRGNDAWGTRARWCKVYGKMGTDSISIAIIDHPANKGYPTYWHARGYGLFAANPLGVNVFTNGQSSMNFQVKEGETITFKFRIIITNGSTTITSEQLNKSADQFARQISK